jgi:hypothetical protein
MRTAVMTDGEERFKAVQFCGQRLFVARNVASELAYASDRSKGKDQIVPGGLSGADCRKCPERALKSRDWVS